jgi:ketosteroid isomerase-like protein
MQIKAEQGIGAKAYSSTSSADSDATTQRCAKSGGSVSPPRVAPTPTPAHPHPRATSTRAGEPTVTTNLDRAFVLQTIDTYAKAWISRDPELIVTIFTPDATYHEYVLAEPIRGHAGIRHYWQTRVRGGQSHIEFKLLSLYIDGHTAIAEWEAWFVLTQSGTRKHMKEIAVLEFRGPRIASLREYWSSESLDPPPRRPGDGQTRGRTVRSDGPPRTGGKGRRTARG